jgi:hypothetical protein
MYIKHFNYDGPEEHKIYMLFCWLKSAEFPELSQLNWLRKNTDIDI